MYDLFIGFAIEIGIVGYVLIEHVLIKQRDQADIEFQWLLQLIVYNLKPSTRTVHLFCPLEMGGVDYFELCHGEAVESWEKDGYNFMFENIVHKVTSFGTGDLEENLDFNRERAKYIRNAWVRALYLLCYKISTYLFAFEIGYLGFTRQLDSVDIFAFLTKGRHLILFLVVVALGSGIQLLKDHKLYHEEDYKERKKLEFILDCLRMVAYSLAYRFIMISFIGKTKNTQLIYTGYILLALLVFFYIRKILFWSLFIGKDTPQDSKTFSKKKVKEQAQRDIESKIKQINSLMQNLQKLKKETNAKQTKHQKSDD